MNDMTEEMYQLHITIDELKQQLDELLAALENVLLAHKQEAKAQRAYEVANENYSDPKPESEAWGSAMIEASAAEKRAYAAIAKVNG